MNCFTRGKHALATIVMAFLLMMFMVPSTVLANQAVAGAGGANGLVLEHKDFSDRTFIAAQAIRAAVDVPDSGENAVELRYGENISEIVISYLMGDNWVEITQDNNHDLPATAYFQFDFVYQSINVDILLENNNRMIYRDLPDWFVPTGIGAMIYDGSIVGTIECVDGDLVITFFDSWLIQYAGHSLNGTFSVSGVADWHQIPEDSEGSEIPGLAVVPDFERGLAEKYGEVDVEKTLLPSNDSPNVIQEDGKYYLEYQITVTNREEAFDVSNVIVRDTFSTPGYIAGYTQYDSGSVSLENNELIWTVGTLKKSESKVLTYRVQIAEDYVTALRSNAILNTAEVFSDGILHDEDTVGFTPVNKVRVIKANTGPVIDSSGNGTITYTVQILADAENSFVLKDLELVDSVPEMFRDAIHGDENGLLTVLVNGEEHVVGYSNGTFKLSGIELSPGETVEITYTLNISDIFFLQEGEITIENTATLYSGERQLSSAVSTATTRKNSWVKKISGEYTQNEREFVMGPGTVYGQSQEAERFTVPKGALRYDVVLNEDSIWNLNSAALTDDFDNNYLKYTGYLRVQAFERAGGSSEVLTDAELLEALSAETPVRTAWLNIDGQGRFSFKPQDLEFEEDKPYTFLLTYYALSNGVENIGSVSVANHFEVSGYVGIGNGGDKKYLPGIRVSVESVVQGSLKYNALKSDWYYTSTPDVYRTEAVGDGYTEYDFKNDYLKGALYWTIRLDGDIKPGVVTGVGPDAKFGGFYIKDTPVTSKFNRDAVVGVYKGDPEFDFRAYESYPDFMEAFTQEDSTIDLEKLEGNPKNDKYFYTYYSEENPDYKWYATNNELQALLFSEDFINEKYDKENEAIYVVLRTTPTGMPELRKSIDYKNTLSVNSGAGAVKINEAYQTVWNKAVLHKESKGAYLYDQEKKTFENISNRPGGDWLPKKKIDTEKLPASGLYGMWLLNVNYNGTYEGTLDVADYLPEGMEFVYATVNNFGSDIKTTPELFPRSGYIPELDQDSDWVESTYTTTVEGYPVELITYYNQNENTIRWRINNFTKRTLESTEKREINLIIVTRITDPELLIGNATKTYINRAAAYNLAGDEIDIDQADVSPTVQIDKVLAQSFNQNVDGTFIVNEIPYEIRINPFKEKIVEGDTLPTLIDVLSEGARFNLSSLEILVNGQTYQEALYTVVGLEDEREELLISNLPNAASIIIKYSIRLNVQPNTPINIENKAYWAGQEPPEEAQSRVENARYNPSGDVFVQDNINIKVVKVDSSQNSKRLNGAVFSLYEVGVQETLIGTGVTDYQGEVVFNNSNIESGQSLKFNQVYKLVETKAPQGYSLPQDNAQYFILVDYLHGETPDLEELKTIYPDLIVSYDGALFELYRGNSKDPISIEKEFENSTDYSGTFSFGLFEAPVDFNNPSTPVEVLTLTYTDGRLVGIQRDGVAADTASFSKNDPNLFYEVYELDVQGRPVKDQHVVTVDGQDYRVSYPGRDSKYVAMGETVEVSNKAITSTQLSADVVKTIVGDNAEAGAFTFELQADPDNAYGAILPENTALTLIYDGSEDSVLYGQFDPITFTNPGYYTFFIHEVEGDNPKYHYDDRVYTLNVTIGEDTADLYVVFTEYFDLHEEVLEYTQGALFFNVYEEDTADPETGSLVISKTVEGGESSELFGFEIFLSDEEVYGPYGEITFAQGYAELTLTDGDSKTATGLPQGITYTVKEIPTEGYTAEQDTFTGTIEKDRLSAAGFVNIKDDEFFDEGLPKEEEETGALKISKTVVGEDENFTGKFRFRITFKDSEISGPFGGLNFEKGVAEFELGNGDSIHISKLPLGLSYVVEELNSTGYTVTSTGETGTVEALETLVSFVNTKESHTVEKPEVTPPTETKIPDPVITKEQQFGDSQITREALNVTRNGILTYYITVSNPSDYPFYDLEVTDRIPAGLEYVAGSADHGGIYAGGQMFWHLDELGAGRAVTLSFKVTVPKNEQVIHWENTAILEWKDKVIASNTVVADTPKLSILKEQSTSGQRHVDRTTSYIEFVPGDIITYYITVTNTGKVDAHNVVITDPFPSGLDFIQESASEGVTVENNTLIWRVGTLGAGENKTVEFSFSCQLPESVLEKIYFKNTAYVNWDEWGSKNPKPSNEVICGDPPEEIVETPDDNMTPEDVENNGTGSDERPSGNGSVQEPDKNPEPEKVQNGTEQTEVTETVVTSGTGNTNTTTNTTGVGVSPQTGVTVTLGECILVFGVALLGLYLVQKKSTR